MEPDPPHPLDLVVTATPSLGGAVAAARIAQRLDVPLLTIVQDLMAKATAQSGISGGGAVTKTTARLEGYALRRATRVAVVSDSFRTAVEAYGVDSDRIELLPNWTHVTPGTLDRDEARRRLGWDTDAFIVAHTGNIGLKQDLGTVVEAARLLTDEPDLAVLIIGDGSQRAAVADQANDVPTVRMLPPLDAEQYPLALAAADVLLVNERPSVGDMSLPSKLTSYLAATRPVLAAVAPDGATAAEVVASDAGVVVPAGDPAALATALVELRADPGRRLRMSQAAHGYARERLSAHTSMRRLADLACQAAPAKRRKLRAFRPDGYDKGRGRLWQIAWFVTMNLVFRAWWCPARLRPAILRAFGARVGKRVLIRHRVRVLWPWKLSIGDDCWVGEDAWLLNLEPITLDARRLPQPRRHALHRQPRPPRPGVPLRQRPHQRRDRRLGRRPRHRAPRVQSACRAGRRQPGRRSAHPQRGRRCRRAGELSRPVHSPAARSRRARDSCTSSCVAMT